MTSLEPMTTAVGAGTKALLGAADTGAPVLQPAVLHGTGVQSIPVPGVGHVLVQRVEPGSARPFGDQGSDIGESIRALGVELDELRAGTNRIDAHIDQGYAEHVERIAALREAMEATGGRPTSIGLLNDHRHVRPAIAEPAPAPPASNVIGDSTSWDMIPS